MSPSTIILAQLVAVFQQVQAPELKELVRLDADRQRVTHLRFSPDSKVLATSGYEDVVKIWEVPSGKKLHVLEAGTRRNRLPIEFSQNGDHLFTAGTEEGKSPKDIYAFIKKWEVSSGRAVTKVPLDSDHQFECTWSAVVSPKGDRLYLGLGSSLGVLNAGNLRSIAYLPLGALRRSESGNLVMSTFGLAVSPDGKKVACGGSAQAIKMWDTGTLKELHSLTGHTKEVTSLAFSPDGSVLASCSYDMSVKIWDVATGKEIRSIQSPANSVLFLPSGRILLSGDSSGVGIWNVETGKQLKEVAASAELLALSTDGPYLAAGGNTVTLFKVEFPTKTESGK